MGFVALDRSGVVLRSLPGVVSGAAAAGVEAGWELGLRDSGKSGKRIAPRKGGRSGNISGGPPPERHLAAEKTTAPRSRKLLDMCMVMNMWRNTIHSRRSNLVNHGNTAGHMTRLWQPHLWQIPSPSVRDTQSRHRHCHKARKDAICQ